MEKNDIQYISGLHKKFFELYKECITYEVNNIPYEAFDDDNNAFQFIDLPGICDTKNKNDKINKMTYDTVIESDLVIFVSDVTKTFLKCTCKVY